MINKSLDDKAKSEGKLVSSDLQTVSKKINKYKSKKFMMRNKLLNRVASKINHVKTRQIQHEKFIINDRARMHHLTQIINSAISK